ncbi:MAG: mandelate racemase/muconate lactonizing enzyme family protein [Ktedonobacterales bacterium]|nr:mandelate racemase/muconate lactonizing enzyme family protein [Ktedonobacterales bacterium]
MAAGEHAGPAAALAQPIDAIDAFLVRVPLDERLLVFGKLISSRDFVIVRVRAGEYVGTGYAFTRGAALDHAVRDQIAPLVVGQPIAAIHQGWDAARAAARMTGEGGSYARALAVVDIARWDLLGQALGVPLWQVWGGVATPIPCLAIMGYYREADAVAALRREAERLAEAGYQWFKIPFGADAALDQHRLAALREVVGPDALIALDAGAAFASVKEASAAWAAVEGYHPAFLEDPFAASAWELAITLAQQTQIPIAFGESIASPGTMQRLGRTSGVDIIRPDATHQMGVTGYLRGTAVAREAGVRIFPHYFPDLHASLVSAWGGEMIEESPAEVDTVAFRHLRAVQPDIRAGMWHLSDRPGFGIVWDEAALQRYRRPSPS